MHLTKLIEYIHIEVISINIGIGCPLRAQASLSSESLDPVLTLDDTKHPLMEGFKFPNMTSHAPVEGEIISKERNH